MEPIAEGAVWLGDRPGVLLAIVGGIAVLLTALVVMVFSDASMRHFVVECTSDGGHVEVVHRELVCLGGRP